jgi:hypothetical protein
MLLSRALRRGFDSVGGLERLDLVGKFGSSRAAILAGLVPCCGQFRLELIAQFGQFRQICLMRERLAQAGLVVAKLGFGDG